MRLFAKLLVVVVAVGAMGLALLALRQQRYEVSNEISRTHNRIVEQERARWRLRAEVARLSDPADIRAAAERRGIELSPVQEASATPDAALGSREPASSSKAASAAKAASAPKPVKPKASSGNRTPSSKAGSSDRR